MTPTVSVTPGKSTTSPVISSESETTLIGKYGFVLFVVVEFAVQEESTKYF